MRWAGRIPPEVIAACGRLQEAGFAAYVVGGAVRDLLLSPSSDKAKDFDLTTSATPDEVIAVFGRRKVIPTGIAHGTVTVLCDRAEGKPHPVEITTFRGEVGFSDGRRPDRVEFITDLTEDLRRRDFTVNAIAFDPVADRLVDPFDGQGDLGRKLIRAVGDPAARFAEDGLRVMRAVRFAAQLGFVVERQTRAAFSGALPTLRKVSRERIRDELQKLLSSPAPRKGLRLMCEYSEESSTFDWGPDGNILSVVFPELALVISESTSLERWCSMIERVIPSLRLAALLWPLREWLLGAGAAVAVVPRALGELLDERLKLSASERQLLVSILTVPLLRAELLPHLVGPALRRFLSEHPQPVLDAVLALQLVAADASEDESFADGLHALIARMRAERALHPPLSTADLAIGGKDLIASLGLSPGPMVGDLLRDLLSLTLDDPGLNTREKLIELARERTSARNFRH